jgi:hypothetical protein
VDSLRRRSTNRCVILVRCLPWILSGEEVQTGDRLISLKVEGRDFTQEKKYVQDRARRILFRLSCVDSLRNADVYCRILTYDDVH